jgi:hypothetical protein
MAQYESDDRCLDVGADIVYRQPLLTTLEQLLLPTANAAVKCSIFATQSSHASISRCILLYARATERGFCKTHTHIADVWVPQGMSDELAQVVPAVSKRKEIDVVYSLELSRSWRRKHEMRETACLYGVNTRCSHPNGRTAV